MDELCKQLFIGKTFNDKKKTITIKKIDIFGGVDKLIINLEVAGSINGQIYLTGTPFYNKEKQSIDITNFDYEVKTKNKIIKTANWLYHSQFVKTMEPKLSFSIKNEIKEAKQMITSNLVNNKIHKNVIINGLVETIDIDSIFITENKLEILINMNGQVNAKITGIIDNK